MNTAPKHSFVILAYQESPFLEECICALQNQTVKSDLVLSTSTPSDFLETIAKKYGVPLLVNKNSQGIAADWNFAFDHCHTEFLTLAHQDDLYMPDYTKNCLDAAYQSNTSLIVFTDYNELVHDQIRDNNLLLNVKRLILSIFYVCKKNLSSKIMKKGLLSIANPICCPTIMYNKKRIGQFEFNRSFSMNLDWEASLNLSERKGDFIYVKQKLLTRRIHSESESTNALMNKSRQMEDQKLLEKFWPKAIARLLVKFYYLAYLSNE